MTTPNKTNRCPQCGGKVFHAIPGETTAGEITAFKQELARRRGVPLEEPDWIHPGSFCHDCDWGVLAHYILPNLGDTVRDERDAILVLDSSGPDLVAVAAVLKSHLGISSKEALALARVGQGPITPGSEVGLWQLKEFEAAIVRAGGSAHIERIG